VASFTWGRTSADCRDLILQFLGAAHCVTSPNYLLTLNGDYAIRPRRVRVDYGLFLGLRERRQHADFRSSTSVV
jgi:hypothetical protein